MRADAEAICEAVTRANMRFVANKDAPSSTQLSDAAIARAIYSFAAGLR